MRRYVIPETRETMIAPLHRFLSRLASLHAALIVAAMALALLLLGLNGVWALQEREDAIAHVQTDTGDLARSLIQHANDIIQSSDAVLVDLRERVEVDGMAVDQVDRLQQMMLARSLALPMIHELFVYDAAGDRIATSSSASNPIRNATDRDYFQYHATHPSRAIHLGHPIRSKTDGQWIITLSRRLDGPNQAFAGVVVVTIAVDYLERFYTSFHVGTDGVIVLDTMDGIMVARKPADDAMIGMDMSKGPIFRDYLPHASSGGFEYLSPIDGVTRIGSYGQIGDYPLLIIVALGKNEALASWRAKTWSHMTVNLVISAGLIFAGSHFARLIKRRQESDYFYQLLANNSSDAIICLTMEGQKVYVSPALVRMTGWSAEAHMTRPWNDFIHPDDWPTVDTVPTKLMSGNNQAAVSFRYICKDGSHLWVESRVQLLHRGQGHPPCLVANIRDITERKAADRLVAALNQELLSQANTDALTGLANRRCLNDTLDREWRRAFRDANAISLIMIDVDRFKLYNDQFGHQEGDLCLSQVAAAINPFGSRTGDLVARYGGEEIAVLLPGTHAAPAIELAGKIRTAIEAIRIDHPANTPTGVVTASFGVATLLPRMVDSINGPADLIAIADAALYEAKHTGRNRVVAARRPEHQVA